MGTLLIVAVALLALAAGPVFPRRARSAVAAEPPARPDQLEGLARALLGREPAPGDPLPAPGDGVTLRDAVRAVAVSDAHRVALAAGEAGVLAGTTAAEAALAPGTLSPDGVAIVGSGGWLFIAHGSNDFVRQYRGETPLSDDGLAAWGRVLDGSAAAAARLGIPIAHLAVPDKLAIYPEHYPEPLDPEARRPMLQLLDAHPGRIAYPLDELRGAAAERDVSLRTDSHVSAEGAEILAGAALAALGMSSLVSPDERPRRSYLTSGDLGARFTPQIHEVAVAPPFRGSLTLVEDNADRLLACGGHLGMRRVSHNPAAPVDARLVVFGDSYSYVDPGVPGNLGELLASAVREVHFLWAPFCWDTGYLERCRPDAVLLQMAERFAVTVPRGALDVGALETETLRRRRGIVPEEITSPATA